LKVVGVNVEGVVHSGFIGNHPVFDGAQLHLVVNAMVTKGSAVN
jgi:hypothetical protein